MSTEEKERFRQCIIASSPAMGRDMATQVCAEAVFSSRGYRLTRRASNSGRSRRSTSRRASTRHRSSLRRSSLRRSSKQ